MPDMWSMICIRKWSFDRMLPWRCVIACQLHSMFALLWNSKKGSLSWFASSTGRHCPVKCSPNTIFQHLDMEQFTNCWFAAGARLEQSLARNFRCCKCFWNNVLPLIGVSPLMEWTPSSVFLLCGHYHTGHVLGGFKHTGQVQVTYTPYRFEI